MEYLHTMVRVTDLEKSLAFYCGVLGMVESGRKSFEEHRFTLVFLAASGDADSAKQSSEIVEQRRPTLELTYNWPDENGEPAKELPFETSRNWGHVAFAVDDIYATCQKLMDAGITICRPPRDGYLAFIRSPDGISIEFLQKGEALPPQEPWASMGNTGTW